MFARGTAVFRGGGRYGGAKTCLITTQAAVVWGPNQPFSVEEVSLGDPRDDEILVEMQACGICHTDIAVQHQHIPSAFPIVLGHEGVGVVRSVGKSVTNIEPRDHVILSYGYCGHCPSCNRNRHSYCTSHRNINFSGLRADGSTYITHGSGETEIHGAFFRQSSFANLVIAGEKNAIRVPKDIKAPLHSLAPLGCGVQTGAGAVLNALKPFPGSAIAVTGCGSVGLSSIMAAKVSGCSRIVAVDPNRQRTSLSMELGATEWAESIEELDTPVDFVVDTTGIPAVLGAGFKKLVTGGTSILLGGSKPGAVVELDMLDILLGRNIKGVIQGESNSQQFIPLLLDLHSRGEFPFDRMITYYESLHDINRAIDDMNSGKVVKPVLRLGQSI